MYNNDFSCGVTLKDNTDIVIQLEIERLDYLRTVLEFHPIRISKRDTLHVTYIRIFKNNPIRK